MPVVKALVGGVIGGCLGAYIVNLIGPVRGAAGPWLILLAGLGAGLGTRLISGANRNFITESSRRLPRSWRRHYQLFHGGGRTAIE